MIAASLILLLLAVPGVPGQPAPNSGIVVTMLAVEASNAQGTVRADTRAEKHFGPGLDESTCNALKELPYTSFRKIASGKAKTECNHEARLTINDTYTLCVEPLSKDSTGLIRAKVWIEERSEDADAKEPIRKALMTTVKAVSGDKMMLGGLKLPTGDLVVELTLKG